MPLHDGGMHVHDYAAGCITACSIGRHRDQSTQDCGLVLNVDGAVGDFVEINILRGGVESCVIQEVAAIGENHRTLEKRQSRRLT